MMQSPSDMKEELNLRAEQTERIKEECKRKFIAEIALQLAIQNNTKLEMQIERAQILARDHDKYVYR